MILDWTNWTFWLITLALVAFGFCLRDISTNGTSAKFARRFATRFARSTI